MTFESDHPDIIKQLRVLDIPKIVSHVHLPETITPDAENPAPRVAIKGAKVHLGSAMTTQSSSDKGIQTDAQEVNDMSERNTLLARARSLMAVAGHSFMDSKIEQAILSGNYDAARSYMARLTAIEGGQAAGEITAPWIGIPHKKGGEKSPENPDVATQDAKQEVASAPPARHKHSRGI